MQAEQKAGRASMEGKENRKGKLGKQARTQAGKKTSKRKGKQKGKQERQQVRERRACKAS